MKPALITALLLLSPALARADEPIKVLSQNGAAIQPGRTKLALVGDTGTRVHQVIASGAGVANYAFGGWGSSYSETTQLLCSAPCTIEVPNGVYELRASDNLVFGGRFTVVANGPDQTWAVEDANAGLGVLGILGTGLGLGSAIGGAMLLGFDNEDLGGAPVAGALTAGGVALAAVGIWALVEAFAGAEQVGGS